MQEYTVQIKRNLVQLLVLAVGEIGIAWGYGYEMAALSLLLGNIASIIYFWQLTSRVKRSSALPAGKAVAKMQFGWILSLVFIALFLALSTKIMQVDFLFVVIGMFSFQIALFIDSIVIALKSVLILIRKG
ncbi:MAG: synthase chain [Firmicutes bacterium]|nr:synthase chain [Bacillota bacterium]